jgi:hypothetical protein
MSDVLRRVALVHAERFEGKTKERLLKKRKAAARQAYFRDSGILDMFEDIKNIQIANPVPELIDGFTVTFNDLVIPTDHDYLVGAGISFYDKDSREVSWYVNDSSDTASEQPTLHYEWCGAKLSGDLRVDAPDAKQKFVDSFVKWLARKITPQMLADMNIDMSPAAEAKKPSRKFLQVAE